MPNLKSVTVSKNRRFCKSFCHCLYHASTRIDVVTHMPLWTYISCHPFRDVPIFSSRHLPVTFACAAASRIAIMAGISNHQRTCRSIASWKTAELSLAQFDYMAWEEAWWSHWGNQTLDIWFEVQSSNPSTNNDKLRLLYKTCWSDSTLAIVLHLENLFIINAIYWERNFLPACFIGLN